MKQIQLTQGKVALVDDEDFEELNKHKWCCNNGYAVRAKGEKKGESGGTYTLRMHRVVMKLGDGAKNRRIVVDHINRNTLDNRKENLRICFQSENAKNQRKKNKFGYKGIVKYYQNTGKYQVMIWNGIKNLHVGTFAGKELAAKAYDKAAKKLNGAFAFLNFPDE